MTTLAIAGPHGSLAGSWKARRPGVSDAAISIRDVITRAFDDFSASAIGQARFLEPVTALRRLAAECSQPNWNAEGAEPITPATLSTAEEVLYALPAEVPTPEFLPEPTGRIAFEWYKGRHRIYVLSVGSDSALEFAGLFGRGNEVHGRFNFSDLLPGLVLDHLRELLAH